MGFLLSRIAVALFLIVGPINFLIVLIRKAKAHNFLKVINGYFYQDALSMDVFGNYRYRTTWNTIFIKKGGYKFGVKGETISSALGKNQAVKTLSIGGWITVILLYIIDVRFWFKGGHCLNSMKDPEEILETAIG